MREKSLKIVGRVVPDGKGGVALPLSIETDKGVRPLTYSLTLSADQLARQEHEPILAVVDVSWWLFRNVVVDARGAPQDELPLRIKHFVLRHEKALSRIRHEVEAFENLSRLP